MRSRHSSLIERTNRSAYAFAFGARSGVRTTRTPASRHYWRLRLADDQVSVGDERCFVGQTRHARERRALRPAVTAGGAVAVHFDRAVAAAVRNPDPVVDGSGPSRLEIVMFRTSLPEPGRSPRYSNRV